LVAYGSVLDWKTPFDSCRQPLLDGYHTGLKMGDLESGLWCFFFCLWFSLFQSSPITCTSFLAETVIFLGFFFVDNKPKKSGRLPRKSFVFFRRKTSLHKENVMKTRSSKSIKTSSNGTVFTNNYIVDPVLPKRRSKNEKLNYGNVLLL
jgi:hypothetical protein